MQTCATQHAQCTTVDTRFIYAATNCCVISCLTPSRFLAHCFSSSAERKKREQALDPPGHAVLPHRALFEFGFVPSAISWRDLNYGVLFVFPLTRNTILFDGLLSCIPEEWHTTTNGWVILCFPLLLMGDEGRHKPPSEPKLNTLAQCSSGPSAVPRCNLKVANS